MFIITVAVKLRINIPLVNIYPHPKSIWMVLDFLSHVFMLHGVIPLFDNAAGNPPLWSLAREEYLYLMYFILLGWRHLKGIFSGVFMSFVSGVCFYLIMALLLPKGSSWWGIIITSSLVLWIQWCLGALAIEAYYGLIKLPRWCYWLWLIPVWAVVSKLSENYLPVLSPLLWGMTFFTLLNFCAVKEKENRWKINIITEWFAYAGLISYSLYLIHYPVRGIMKQLLGPLAMTQNPWFYFVNAAIMATAGYYAGKLFFIFIESRFLVKKAK
jgi:peptidoglycan/LPS O-acetylase OafA/YrhL